MMILKLTVGLLITAEVVLSVSYYNYLAGSSNCQKQHCEKPYYKTEAHYEYNPNRCNGQEEWHELADCWEFCDKEDNFLQSPINIRLQDTTYNRFPTFQYHDTLCQRIPAKAKNKGEAPVFDAGNLPTGVKITNVPHQNPRDVYTFSEMSIHFGKDRKKGSEHAVDVKYFPLEVHMMFWNEKYANAQAAKDKKDGLVVIGVFVMVSPNKTMENRSFRRARMPKQKTRRRKVITCSCHDNDYICIRLGRCACTDKYDCPKHSLCRFYSASGPTRGYCSRPKECPVRDAKTLSQIMTQYFPQIQPYQTPPTEAVITQGISPYDALPLSWDFYTYKGSFTAPPCFETVRWIIMRCPIMVTEQAYQSLIQIHDRRHRPLKTHGVQRLIQRGLPAQRGVRDVERNFEWDRPIGLLQDCPPSPKA